MFEFIVFLGLLSISIGFTFLLFDIGLSGSVKNSFFYKTFKDICEQIKEN